MVAKSYQGLEIATDVYAGANGRTYVKVRLGNGTLKQVRWYSDKEYARMYGAAAEVDHSNDPFYKTQKEVLGFGEGYITIFKGDTYAAKEQLKEAGARYTKLWGWGIAGGQEVPEIAGIEPVRLDWSMVGRDDKALKTDDEVIATIESMLYEPSKSEFQGEVGERLRDILVKVVRSFKISSYYGESTVHDFEDEDGNVYSWITASKSLPEGGVYWLTGTVKDHKIYKNVKKTILFRCKVEEEVA